MFKQANISGLLIAAFALETFCVSYGLNLKNMIPLLSVLYLLSGMGFSVLILFMPAKPLKIIYKNNIPSIYVRIFSLTLLSILIYFFSKSILEENPIDYHHADMLPVIETMNKRFLAGHWRHVYDPIAEIWNGSMPIYLPAMWLPYLPAVGLGIDLRWTTVCCLFFVFALPIFFLPLRKIQSYFILAIAASLLLWLFLEDDTHSFISMSEEGVVIFYYALLVMALFTENIYFISFATILCLLSRYALVGWLPAYFIFLLLSKNKNKALVFAVLGILSCFLFFILPFGFSTFSRLLHLPSQYVGFANRVWMDSPEVFTESMGLAKFFVPNHGSLLHGLLIGASFIFPTAFICFCLYHKNKISFSYIPVAALKFSLVIFYNLIDVPYLYLFYTSSFVSLLSIVFLLGKNKTVVDPTIFRQASARP